jgi:hypothetical protein
MSRKCGGSRQRGGTSAIEGEPDGRRMRPEPLDPEQSRQRTSSVIASPSDERLCDIVQRRHLPASMA